MLDLVVFISLFFCTNISFSDINTPSVYLSIKSDIDNNVSPSSDDVRAFLLGTPVYECGAEDGECRSLLLFRLLKDYPDIIVDAIISLGQLSQKSVLREFSEPIQEWDYKEIADNIDSIGCNNSVIADLKSIMMQLYKDNRHCIEYCYIYPSEEIIKLYPSTIADKSSELDLSKLTDIIEIRVFDIIEQYAEVELFYYYPVLDYSQLFMHYCWIDLEEIDTKLSPVWKSRKP